MRMCGNPVYDRESGKTKATCEQEYSLITVKREMFAAIKVRGFPFKMKLALLKFV